MDEGQPGDRPCVNTRARDIRQRRRDDEVDRTRLEIPAELAQLSWGDRVGAGEDHGVGFGCVDRLDRAIVRSEHGHAGRELVGAAALRDGADDDEAVAGVTRDLLVRRAPTTPARP